MKILVLGEYYPPDLGGAATRASNMVKGLALNGCAAIVVTAFPHYPTGKIPKEYKFKLLSVEYFNQTKIVRTAILPIQSKGLLSRLLIFCSFMFSSLFALPFVGKIDAIWATNPDVFVLASATIYSKIKRAPIISNVDDLIIEDAYDLEMVTRGSLPSKIAECAARFLYAQVKFVTPISTGYFSTIVKYGVNPSRIELVRGGVDLDVFKQIPKTSNGKFRVVYSGGFSVAYDFEQVLQTAKTIANIDSDVEFIFQGKGELSNKIIRRIIELKLKNTKIIDKQLSRVEVSEFLNQADVLLLPLAAFKTPYRGMSSKLYEYQAVGKPIICCSNGLPSEFVRETKSGIVVNSGDSAALVNAVLELKNNPESCQIYGRNGRIWVEKEASILAIGLKMKKIFISCIKGNTC